MDRCRRSSFWLRLALPFLEDLHFRLHVLARTLCMNRVTLLGKRRRLGL